METNNTVDRDTLIGILEEKYPKLTIRKSEDFDGTPDRLWCSGEDGTEASDEMPLFNYWCEDYKEITYVFGVHKEIGNLLEQYGWYAEWHDAGTVFIGEV